MVDTGKELEDLVYNYEPTQEQGGFTAVDLELFLLDTKLYEAGKVTAGIVLSKMGTVTCTMYKGTFCYYHCDILTALRCVLEDREMYEHEWD